MLNLGEKEDDLVPNDIELAWSTLSLVVGEFVDRYESLNFDEVLYRNHLNQFVFIKYDVRVIPSLTMWAPMMNLLT